MKRNILITGATYGIGRYVADNFLAKGDFVIIVARDTSKAKTELKKYKDRILCIDADLGKKEDIEKLFDIVEKEVSYLDILINNAAIDEKGYIETYDYDVFKRILEVNLVGKAFCIQKSIPLLRKSNYPSIVNISSRLEDRPRIDGSAYSCGAAAIVMLTKSAAVELEKDKIRVNCISPSVTITPLAQKTFSREIMDQIVKKSTRNRLCEKEDVFNAIEFLTSKKSDFINGENIKLSGGMLHKW